MVLPDEILLLILRFLNFLDILQLSFTCEHLNGLCLDNHFWLKKLKEEHPEILLPSEISTRSWYISLAKYRKKLAAITYGNFLNSANNIVPEINNIFGSTSIDLIHPTSLPLEISTLSSTLWNIEPDISFGRINTWSSAILKSQKYGTKVDLLKKINYTMIIRERGLTIEETIMKGSAKFITREDMIIFLDSYIEKEYKRSYSIISSNGPLSINKLINIGIINVIK